jgi:hypothetical protein
MVSDTLRKLGMAALVGFIVGGLWVLAHYKAELSSPAPEVFRLPLFPSVTSPPIPSFSTGARQSDESSFDQVLFKDDQIVRVG